MGGRRLRSPLQDQLPIVCGLGNRSHPRGTPDPPGLSSAGGREGKMATNPSRGLETHTAAWLRQEGAGQVCPLFVVVMFPFYLFCL